MNKTLYSSAYNGNLDAKFRLAMTYINIFNEYEEALVLLNSCIEHNHPKAIIYLAFMHKKGIGVEKNHAQYCALVEKCTKINDKNAIFFVGLHLFKQQKYLQAFNYFTRADKKNMPLASFFLGLMYLRGLGVDKKLSKAKELLNKSAKYKLKPAKQLLDKINN